MTSLATLRLLLRAVVLDRQRLLLENLALRQQVLVLKRRHPRPHLTDADRLFRIGMRRALREWKNCLLVVKPETVNRWHRRGWRYDWERKSKPHRPGRPSIGWKLVGLIRRLSTENPLWGAPRITAEMARLGHSVAEASVDKYRVRQPPDGGGQRWATFLRNHLRVTAACDLFTVPTATFRNLFVLVVLHHERRHAVGFSPVHTCGGDFSHHRLPSRFHLPFVSTVQELLSAFPPDIGQRQPSNIARSQVPTCAVPLAPDPIQAIPGRAAPCHERSC